MTKIPKSPLDEIIDEIKKAIENGAVLKYAEDAKKDYRLEGSQNEYNDLPDFDFTNKDMEEIKRLNDFPNLLPNDRPWTPLEKFFYAVLWKDGKLKSIKRIIDGMESALDDNNASPEKLVFVYYYFGRHLVKRVYEPIVDQHTMRACCLIQTGKAPERFTADDAENYRHLFMNICKREILRSYEEARLVDSLFFALGKYAKNHPTS